MQGVVVCGRAAEVVCRTVEKGGGAAVLGDGATFVGGGALEEEGRIAEVDDRHKGG